MPRLIIRSNSNEMDKKVAYGGFIDELRSDKTGGVATAQTVTLDIDEFQPNAFQCSVTPSPNYQIAGIGVVGSPGYNYSGVSSDYSISYSPWMKVSNTNSVSWIHDRETKLAVIAIISEAARNELIEKLMEYSLVHGVALPMRDILNLSRNYSATLNHLGKALGATITIAEIKGAKVAIAGITSADIDTLLDIVGA
jgi:hypothetical protein